MSGRRGTEFDPKVLRWLCDVAEALTKIGPCKTEYGEYDLAEIRVTFDGDENTGLAVFGSEFGEHFVVGTWENADA
jgi:hypothetical protein